MDFKTTSKEAFFGMLLHSLDYYRLCHLNATGHGSYVEHLATEEFYNKTSQILDKLIESTQGIEGLLQIEIPKTSLVKGIEEYSSVLFQFIETNRVMFKYSFQQSLIDEIQLNLSLLNYKLKYLK